MLEGADDRTDGARSTVPARGSVAKRCGHGPGCPASGSHGGSKGEAVQIKLSDGDPHRAGVGEEADQS